jgi:tetratricopeptide (TPR) repeat protein
VIGSGLKRLLWPLQRPRRLLVLLTLLGIGFFAGLYLWAWYHLSAGRSALESHHPAEAQAHLRQCLGIWPACVEARLLAARAARRTGDFPQANYHLDECRRLAGGQASAEIALEWALLRAAAGDLALVEEPLRERLEKDPPSRPLVLEALAEGYRRMSRIHDALACVEDWMRIQPENLQAVFQRGEIHRQVGAVKKAADDYQAVLERDPDQEPARRHLARCLVQVGRYPEALRHAETLLRRHPEDLELLVVAARARYDLGQKDEARKLLQDTAEAHPDCGPALVELGRIEAGAGRDATAERWLRQAVGAQPHDYQAVYALSQCLQRQGKEPDAAVYSERARRLKDRIERVSEIQRIEMSKRPFDPALRVEMGTALLELGKKESGLGWLLSALELDGRHAAAHAALAEYYRQEGDTARAAFHRQAASER